MEGNSHGFTHENDLNDYMPGLDLAWPETVGEDYNLSPQTQAYAPPSQAYTTSQTLYEQSYGVPQTSYADTSYSSVYVPQYQQGQDSLAYTTPSYGLEPPNAYNAQAQFANYGQSNPTGTIAPHHLNYGVNPSQFDQEPPSQSQYGAAAAASRPQNASFSLSHDQPLQYGHNNFNQSNIQPPVHNSSNFAPRAASQPATHHQVVKANDQSRNANFQTSLPYDQLNFAATMNATVQQRSAELDRTNINSDLSNGSRSSDRPYLIYGGMFESEETKIPEMPPLVPVVKRKGLSKLTKAKILPKSINAQPQPKKGGSRKESITMTGLKPMTPSAKVGDKRRADGSVKEASPPAVDSELETDSEMSGDDEDEEEHENLSEYRLRVLGFSERPVGVADAAEWDVVGMVWQSRATCTGETIQNALDQYNAYIVNLRTQLRENAQQLGDAEKIPSNSDETGRIRRARQDLTVTVQVSLEAAVKHGYPNVLENLGAYPKLVIALTATLTECNKLKDFKGPLPKAVFGLMAKFTSMTDELLKKAKFDGLQKRWNTYGDEETKEQLKSIIANTRDAKERKEKVEAVAKKEQQERGRQREKASLEQERLTPVNVESATNPSKRSQDGDGSNGKPAKRAAAVESTTKVVPKRSTNLLANNLLGTASKPIPKPLIRKQEAAPAESRLGALLQSIAKPAQAPKPPPPPPRAPETPEQKARRERKESRRHLRVRFKEGDELNEIRVFKHEVAEDEGRDTDMLRDAHDNRSEGMMLKMGRQESDAAMDEADDAMSRPYAAPVAIDFSEMAKTTRYGPTYTSCGGDVEIKTPEQAVQQRYEALELMVIYSDANEIPPSPKEPPIEETGYVPEVRQIGQPTAPWLVQRLREIHHYGPEYAKQASLVRMQERSRDASLIHQSSAPSAPRSEMADPDKAAAAWASLQRLMEDIRGKPYPPLEPPSYMNAAAKTQWWEGYYFDNPGKRPVQAAQVTPSQPPTSYQPLMSQMTGASSQTSAPQMTPQMNYHQMQQPHLSYHTAVVPDVIPKPHNYHAALNAQNANNPNIPASVAKELDITSYPDFDFASWSKDPQGYTQKMYALHQYRDRERSEKDTEGDEDDDDDAPAEKRRKFNEHGEYVGKKLPCRFWSQGKCAKGAKCTYLHE